MQKFNLNEYKVEPDNKVAKRVIYHDEQALAFVLNIATGQSLPTHTHYDSTVLLQVLTGKADVKINGEPEPVTAGDLLQIDGPEEMAVDNTGSDTLRLYVTISPTPTDDKYKTDADF